MRRFALLVLLVPACAGPRPDSSSATTTVELGRAHAWLEFPVSGDPVRKGPLVAGGSFAIDYPLQRLPTCRGTHNGFPAWDLQAFVRFLPSGVTNSGSVRAFGAPNGVPQNALAYAIPFDSAIPDGTTAVDVWFYNYTGAGDGCVAWDSVYGQNYHFDVSADPPLPAVGWAGDWAGSDGQWGYQHHPCTQPGTGIIDPLPVDRTSYDDYCKWVVASVYVPGVTDIDQNYLYANDILAQAQWSVDDGAVRTSWLHYVGGYNHDLQYYWDFKAEHPTTLWHTIHFTFRFSTDGVNWTVIGLDDGQPRTIVETDAPDWVGNFSARLNRDESDPCAGTPLDQGFTFDEYARERAAITNLCFEVWKPGWTDWDNPSLWQQFDTEIHYQMDGGAEQMAYVNIIGRVGNNARYALDIRPLDINDGATHGLDYWFTINGLEVGGPFHGTFTR